MVCGWGVFVFVDGVCLYWLLVFFVVELYLVSLLFFSLFGWVWLGLCECFIGLIDIVWCVCVYGDFLFYCLVVEGVVDIVVEL